MKVMNILCAIRSSFVGVVLFCLLGCKGENQQVSDMPKTQDSISGQHHVALSLFKKEGDAYILPWDLLLDIKFKDSFMVHMQDTMPIPVFNDTLKALDGQIVIAEGYYIPVSETGDDNIVIVSAYPYSNCFFCGKAGVESIIDVLSPQKAPKIKLDNKVRFKGRFKLNVANFEYLIYMIEEAEYIGIKE